MNTFLWLDVDGGVSQRQRLINALQPANVNIDGRTTNDLIAFIADFSQILNYYNQRNENEGDWYNFLISDFAIYITLLSTFYPIEKKEIDRLLNEITNSRDVSSNLQNIDGYCEAIINFSKKLVAFYNGYININYFENISQYESTDSEAEMRNKKNVLLAELSIGAANISAKIAELEVKQSDLRYLAKLNDELNTKKKRLSEIDGHLLTLNNLLQDIFNSYNSLQGLANFYLTGTNVVNGNDAPHIGLIKTFLHLYSHLCRQINNITGRHLDYYYRQLLKINFSGAVADRVYVLLSAEAAIAPILISKGDILIAEDENNNNKPVKYAVTQNLYVTKTKIEKLYTIFISNYVQAKAASLLEDDVKEAQVYKAAHPVISPQNIAAGGASLISWPVMGEDQHVKPAGKTVMQYADIGFILGSPIFYQKAGQRQFHIKFHLTVPSYKNLKNYVSNFSKVVQKSENLALHELFFDSFVVSYTADDGWVPVLKCAVRFNMADGGERSLDFQFTAAGSDKPFNIYNKDKHGGNFNTGRPLIRFLINNHSPHNAYTFLRSVVLERITARVLVEDFSNFYLKNNIGALSPGSPFQPFGPQPIISSFLQIKNSNIFNKFTRALTITLDWLGLPSVINGFDAYYAAYRANLTNKCFKATLAAIGGNEKGSANAQTQMVDLFDVYTDENGNVHLCNSTVLNTIQVNKLAFENGMLLDREKSVRFDGKQPGGIKLELVSPKDAFGHNLFTTLLPEVLMYNAKKGVKAPMAVPPPPYTPILNGVSCDFTLEHTEVLNSSAKSIGTGDNFDLFHVYPYGSNGAYTPASGAVVFLMPQLVDAGNLIIGLKDLNAGDELALLFLIDGASTANDTAFEPEQVEWSYLQNNNWIDFQKEEVLADSTNNLTESGIITLKIPQSVVAGNNTIIYGEGLSWLRASIQQLPKLKSCVAGLFVHALEAERVLTLTDISTKQQPVLLPGAIKRFEKKVGGIQKISQPFVSFGGKAEETDEQYYLRVSERLHHRNRPQTALDIAQLILQAFPDILTVKPIIKNMMPQHQRNTNDIVIVIVPRLALAERMAIGEPKASFALLYKTEQFVRQRISLFLNVKAWNPHYEKVKVVCKVKFKDGQYRDGNLLKKRLESDIKQYICPWLFDEAFDIKIGTATIYVQDFLKYIKSQPYVAYVTGFSLLHFCNIQNESGQLCAIINDTAAESVGFIQASGPASILVASPSHIISIIDKEEFSPPLPQGIGGLAIGSELLTRQRKAVASKQGHQKPEEDNGIEYFTFTINP